MMDSIWIQVLNMSLAASYVAIVVIFARWLLKKLPKVFSYGLWIFVLYRLLCPFSFSSAISFFSLFSRVNGQSVQLNPIPTDNGIMATPAVNTGVGSVDVYVNGILPAAQGITSVNPMQIWIFLTAWIWIAGILILLIHATVSTIRLRRRIQTAAFVEAGVYQSDQISGPFVYGLVKPKIYLPFGLNSTEQSFIISHERVHIKRMDYLIKPLAYLALVLHWFNPLMWLCFSLMQRDMEMSCDERVLRTSGAEAVKAYSHSLLALASSRRGLSPSPLAFGESDVKARIRNVITYRKPSFWFVGLAVLLLVILATGLLTNPEADFGLYDHPQTYLSSSSLRQPASVVVEDREAGMICFVTDPQAIAQVVTIVESIRIGSQEVDQSRSSEREGRFSISYYASPGNDADALRYMVHLSPVWIDNGIKPTLSFPMNNKQAIYKQTEAFLNDQGSTYQVGELLAAKTPYVGDASKVSALLNALPLQKGILRGTLQLQTKTEPFGVIDHSTLEDDNTVVDHNQLKVNAIVALALIDNADSVTYLVHWSNPVLSSLAGQVTVTRAEAEKLIGSSLNQYSDDLEGLMELIHLLHRR